MRCIIFKITKKSIKYSQARVRQPGYMLQTCEILYINIDFIRKSDEVRSSLVLYLYLL